MIKDMNCRVKFSRWFEKAVRNVNLPRKTWSKKQVRPHKNTQIMQDFKEKQNSDLICTLVK